MGTRGDTSKIAAATSSSSRIDEYVKTAAACEHHHVKGDTGEQDDDGDEGRSPLRAVRHRIPIADELKRPIQRAQLPTGPTSRRLPALRTRRGAGRASATNLTHGFNKSAMRCMRRDSHFVRAFLVILQTSGKLKSAA